jgi:Zn-dependent peptidase ImmA (M78 family)/transcriptional regulator with XRE-family HTH domain
VSPNRGVSDRAADVATRFDGERLALARQLAGLRKSELASLIGKSATAVAAWESGTKHPTPAAVAQLSLGLEVDPEFFAVRGSGAFATASPPHFRSLRSTSQLARDQAFAFGMLTLAIADGLERHVELPTAELLSMPVALDATDDAPERAAQELRAHWGVGDGPLRHVVRLAERHGVLVVFSPPQTATVDAYSFVGACRPLVVLNPIKGDYYRQRFDVAHELGHLVMHGDAEPGSRAAEDQAHRFAAEFLAPAGEIRDDLPQTMNRQAWSTLARLKEEWGISMQALLYRARRLRRLSDVSYRNAMTTITARGWRRNEPGAISLIEQPSLLAKSVELLVEEGRLQERLAGEFGAPARLFAIATARSPEQLTSSPDAGDSHHEADADSPAKVVSLLRDRSRSD